MRWDIRARIRVYSAIPLTTTLSIFGFLSIFLYIRIQRDAIVYVSRKKLYIYIQHKSRSFKEENKASATAMVASPVDRGSIRSPISPHGPLRIVADSSGLIKMPFETWDSRASNYSILFRVPDSQDINDWLEKWNWSHFWKTIVSRNRNPWYARVTISRHAEIVATQNELHRTTHIFSAHSYAKIKHNFRSFD